MKVQNCIFLLKDIFTESWIYFGRIKLMFFSKICFWENCFFVFIISRFLSGGTKRKQLAENHIRNSLNKLELRVFLKCSFFKWFFFLILALRIRVLHSYPVPWNLHYGRCVLCHPLALLNWKCIILICCCKVQKMSANKIY